MKLLFLIEVSLYLLNNMDLVGKSILMKVKHKSKGNTQLGQAIDELISIIEGSTWTTKDDILKDRPDADQVHSDGFYFFDLNIHRTLVMIELGQGGEASVVWAGNHEDYERIFKNSKDTIKKYLSDRDWI